VSLPRKRAAPRPKLPAAPLRLSRGDVLWINCDPSIGVEPRKLRTCVVVSMDIANEFGAAITVIPTQAYAADRAARAYAVDLRKPRSTIDEPRVANASMIMTYDKARVVSRAGRVHADAMKAIDAALALHLGLAQP
jgi:mRNA-degrading endonuclease toxin of MazEF toxin-antitoxin module